MHKLFNGFAFSIAMQQKTALLLLTFLYLFTISLIGPIHDYPIHDDWHYADAIRHFQETGEVRLDPVVSANILFMVAYGVVSVQLFSGLLGFFGALQLTTLVLGLLGVLVFYLFFRELQLSVLKSFFGACILLFNPLYLLLSFTFMTDVPFVSLLIFSLYFFFRWLREETYLFLVLMLLFTLLSFMIRQHGALFLIALFVFCYLTKKNVYQELVVTGALMGLFMWYRYSVSAASVGYATTFLPGPLAVLFNFLHVPFFFFMYLGFFCFPLLLGSPYKKPSSLRLLKIIFGVLFLFIAFYYYFGQQIMPYMGFTMNAAGLGQIFFLAGEKMSIYPFFVWLAITLLAFLSAGCLVYTCVNAFQKWKALSSPFLFLGILFLLHFVFLLLIARFDRYFLPFVVLLVPFVLVRLTINPKWVSIGLACLAIFSFVGVADYFAWNDARWGAFDALVDSGVAIEEINAGQEWAGWYFFWSHLVQEKSPEATYLISFSLLPRTEVYQVIPYSVLGFDRELYVLTKQ